MLKPYITWNEASIDGGEWREIDAGGNGYIMLDENNSASQMVLDNASFKECFEFLEHNCIFGTVSYKSFFKKKPIIGISYIDNSQKKYKNFDSISIRRVYKEYTDMSLANIMKTFNSDLVIQYLKERGMAICPFNESK